MSGIPKKVQNARKGRYNRQTGLKMQGDANRVDLSRMARRAIKRRVHTNFKVKGYDSDYRCDHGIDPNTVSEEVKESYCYNVNEPGTVLLEPAPFHQSAAGGVGHIYYPRRKCGSRCFADSDNPTPTSSYCNAVSNIQTSLIPNYVKNSSGIWVIDTTNYFLDVSWTNPKVWESNPPEGVYISYLEVVIKQASNDILIDKQLVNIDTNHTKKLMGLLKYGENYRILVITHCSSGTRLTEITTIPAVTPIAPTDCNSIPCFDDDYWYNSIKTTTIDETSEYGYGFKFNAYVPQDTFNLIALNCIDHWNFNILTEDPGDGIITKEKLESIAIKLDKSNENLKDIYTGKIQNIRYSNGFLNIYSKIYVYFKHAKFLKGDDSNLKEVFITEDDRFKPNSKNLFLRLQAVPKSGSKCKVAGSNCDTSTGNCVLPLVIGPIQIGKAIAPPPPPPPPPSPCCPTQADKDKWFGSYSSVPVNANDEDIEDYGITLTIDNTNIPKINCIEKYSIMLETKDTPSQNITIIPAIVLTGDQLKSRFTIKILDEKDPNSSSTTTSYIAGAGFEPDTELNLIITMFSKTTTSSQCTTTSLIKEIPVTTGVEYCNVKAWIGNVVSTPVSSTAESADPEEFGMKFTIDNTSVTNESDIDFYTIRLYYPDDSLPAQNLVYESYDTNKLLNSFEILKKCPTKKENSPIDCFEYTDLSANTNYVLTLSVNNGVIMNDVYNIPLNSTINPNGAFPNFDIENTPPNSPSIPESSCYKLNTNWPSPADGKSNIYRAGIFGSVQDVTRIAIGSSSNADTLNCTPIITPLQYTFSVPQSGSSSSVWVGFRRVDTATYDPNTQNTTITYKNYDFDITGVGVVDMDPQSTAALPIRGDLDLRRQFEACVQLSIPLQPNGNYIKALYFKEVNSQDATTVINGIGQSIAGIQRFAVFPGEITLSVYPDGKVIYKENPLPPTGNVIDMGTLDSGAVYEFFMAFREKDSEVCTITPSCFSIEVKVNDAKSGNEYNPNPGPGPTPPAPQPPVPKILGTPQLYLTVYGDTIFNPIKRQFSATTFILNSGLDEVDAATGITTFPLTNYTNGNYNGGIGTADTVFGNGKNAAEAYWWLIRNLNNTYFKNLKNFITTNNVTNFMILIGDYKQMIPPYVFNTKGTSFFARKNYTSGDCSGNPVLYDSLYGPYGYTAVNGPVDFGLPYSSPNDYWDKFDEQLIDPNTDKAGLGYLAFKKVGNSLILDMLIPLAIELITVGKDPRTVQITANADIKVSDGAWKTWDAGNWTQQKYDSKLRTRDEIPVGRCVGKAAEAIEPGLGYFVFPPNDLFNSNKTAAELTTDTKLPSNVSFFSGYVISPVQTITAGNPIPLEDVLGIETGMYILVNDLKKPTNDPNYSDISYNVFSTVQSIDATNKTITLDDNFQILSLPTPNTGKSRVYFSFIYPFGNVFIGDGSSIDTNGNRVDKGVGCGRSSYFVEPADLTTFPKLITYSTAQANNDPYYNYPNPTQLSIIKYGLNSFPLDNLHQMYITVYYINQKIMELNYYLNHKNTKNTNGTDDTLYLNLGAHKGGYEGVVQIPLITHIHYDKESGSPYTNTTDSPYPNCDSNGNLLKGVGQANTYGLGDRVGAGYLKYLYNKYMPAECLPDWRLNNNPNSNRNMAPTPIGIKVPNSDDILWDQSKPWNKNQQRNFHQDPTGSTGNGGYIFTDNDFSTRTKIDPATGKPCTYDGIQRYQAGWINFQTKAHNRGCGEGILEAYQELYNVGEVKKPLSDTKVTIKDEFLTIDGNGKIVYGPKYTLPNKPTDITKHQIITNSTNDFGSGFIPGSNVPTTVHATKDKISKEIIFKLNSIYNPLLGRVVSKYTPVSEDVDYSDFLGLNSIKKDSTTTYSGQSPAITDIFQRYSAIDGGIVPFDGRGFIETPNGTTNFGADGSPQTADKIVNGPKNTDGYYLPIEPPFVNFTDGVMDLSGIYTNPAPTVQDQKWGVKNAGGTDEATYGPQEPIATFSFEFQSGALNIDPRVDGPSGIIFKGKESPWGDQQQKLLSGLMNEPLAFTTKDRTFTSQLYSNLGQALQFNKNTYSETSSATSWPTNMDASLTKNPWLMPNCENPGGPNCTVDSVTDDNYKNLTVYSGIPAVTPNFWDAPVDSNGIQLGWHFQSTKKGGETNLLSVLNGSDSTGKTVGFGYMEKFIKASAVAMGGVDNVGKIKIGLYSTEFLPTTWLVLKSNEHEY
jgi:hypothetical protein